MRQRAYLRQTGSGGARKEICSRPQAHAASERAGSVGTDAETALVTTRQVQSTSGDAAIIRQPRYAKPRQSA